MLQLKHFLEKPQIFTFSTYPQNIFSFYFIPSSSLLPSAAHSLGFCHASKRLFSPKLSPSIRLILFLVHKLSSWTGTLGVTASHCSLVPCGHTCKMLPQPQAVNTFIASLYAQIRINQKSKHNILTTASYFVITKFGMYLE